MATCDTSASQEFSIFVHSFVNAPPGYGTTYEICVPSSLAAATVSVCKDLGCTGRINVPGYTATCLTPVPLGAERSVKTSIALQKVILAIKYPGTTGYLPTIASFVALNDTVRAGNVFLKFSSIPESNRPGFLYTSEVGGLWPSYPLEAINVGNNWAPMSWSLVK